MKEYLFVNPWIYDFAAHDFGMKPVGLLRIAAQLRREGARVHFIDCLGGCAERRNAYGFSKFRKRQVAPPDALIGVNRPYFRYGIDVDDFAGRIERIADVDGIFVTSGMTYWYPGVRHVIALLRERFKETPVTLGGIYATLCHEHAQATSGATVVWRGDYAGSDPFPGSGDYPAYDILADTTILPLRLTRGCPCRCTYCASHLLYPTFEMRDPVTLFNEVLFLHNRYGATSFLFLDDALLFQCDEGLKPFLRLIAESGVQFMFHTPNGLHARWIDDELAELFRRAGFVQPRLSLETTDPVIQERSGNKVSNRDFLKAVECLRRAGYHGKEIGVYLMAGAPWLDSETTRRDVEYVHSLGAHVIMAAYSPIPGTPAYRALVEEGVIPGVLDPLWHNNTIFGQLLLPSYIEQMRALRRWVRDRNKVL